MEAMFDLPWQDQLGLASARKSEKEVNELRPKFLKQIKKVYSSKGLAPCIAPVSPACKKMPISSHSISKSSVLTRLCDETNHVRMFSAGLSFEKPPAPKVERMGINEASVFHSLCSFHDSEIFKEIDDVVLNISNKRQMFLLSYRTLLRGFYGSLTKYELAKNLFKEQHGDTKRVADEEMPLIVFTYSNYLAHFHVEVLKDKYDEIYRSGNWDRGIRFFAKELPFELPFAVGGFYTPVCDLKGKKVERSNDSNIPWPALTLDLIPQDGNTVICMAVHEYHYPKLVSYLDCIFAIENEDDFVEGIWETTLANCENFVFSAKRWKSFPEGKKKAIEKYFGDTIFNEELIPFPALAKLEIRTKRSNIGTPCAI